MKYFCSVVVANITNIYQLPGPTHQLRIEVVPPKSWAKTTGGAKSRKLWSGVAQTTAARGVIPNCDKEGSAAS